MIDIPLRYKKNKSQSIMGDGSFADNGIRYRAYGRLPVIIAAVANVVNAMKYE